MAIKCDVAPSGQHDCFRQHSITTTTTIFKKISTIIQEKRNFAKNVKNYLDYMVNNCLISDYLLIQGDGDRLHVKIELFNGKNKSHTFNTAKLRIENQL